jgi:hypothetical protein
MGKKYGLLQHRRHVILCSPVDRQLFLKEPDNTFDEAVASEQSAHVVL